MKEDKELMKYIKNKDINYVIIDNENNVMKTTYKNNRYQEYRIKLFLLNTLFQMLK